MSDLYTDDDVSAAVSAVEAVHEDGGWHDYEEEFRAILDVVAPVIAARALRTFANGISQPPRETVPLAAVIDTANQVADKLERDAS